MRFLLETPGQNERIGSAWLLFFDIARCADPAGVFTNSYSQLAKKYGVAVITVKKWRQHLYQNLVIETFSRGSAVTFRLLEPYRNFIKIPDAEGIDDLKERREEMMDLIALKNLLVKTVQGKTREHPGTRKQPLVNNNHEV